MVKEFLSLLIVFIALFLFGIYILRSGLLQVGTSTVKSILIKTTNSPLKGSSLVFL